jgi:hypothetical protein
MHACCTFTKLADMKMYPKQALEENMPWLITNYRIYAICITLTIESIRFHFEQQSASYTVYKDLGYCGSIS